MNILGIDFGTKNIGLAWMQTGLDVVLPFGVIAGTDREQAVDKITQLINEEKIDRIVIGLPLSTDGKENENTERIRNFSDQLKAKISVEIEFINEVFTSKQADRMGDGVSRDEKSAMIILEAYKNKFKN